MRLLPILFLLLACLPATAPIAAPRVVTSITPLQEITSALMAGVASPQAIIGDGASAHHFALRPSHMRLLQQADLVIWIDRHFEAGFGRIAETLPRSVRQLELLPALGMDDNDGHIWYSPGRLQQVVELIKNQLGDIDPDNRPRYRDNAGRLSADIERWRIDTLAQLQSRPPRYITDHAFTHHFETDLGYPAIAAIHDQHDGHGGLGKLDQIEAQLRAQPVACLLTLEPAPSTLALELAQKFHLKVISLAPPATDGAATASVIRRLQQLSAALARCGE